MHTILRISLVFSIFVLFAGCASVAPVGDVASEPENVEPPVPVDPLARANAYYSFSMAQQNMQAGKAEDALRWLENAIRFDPSSPFLYAFKAGLDVKMGDIKGAASSLESSLALDPGYLPALYLQGGLMVALGRLDDAIIAYEKALALRPEARELYIYLIDLYLEKKDLEKAESLAKDMERRFDESSKLHYLRGKIFLLRNDSSDAKKALKRSLELNGQNEDALLLLGLLYEDEGSLDEAIALYESHVELMPHNFRMRSHLVDIYLRKEAYDSAEHENEILALMGAEAGLVARNRGLIALGRGQHADATKYLRESLLSAPGDALTRYYLGSAYLHLKQYEQAKQVFEDLILETDMKAEGNYGLGFSLKEMGKYAEALKSLEKAIAMEPGNMEYRRIYAMTLSDAGRYEEAESVLQDVLREVSVKTPYLFALSAVYEQSGQYEKGIRKMKQVLKSDPDNPDAHNYIGYIYAEMGQNLPEAEKHLRKALEIKPGDPYITDSLGWLYFKIGRLEEALEQLETAASSLGEEPVVLQHLAEVHLALGNHEKAREFFQKSLGFARTTALIEELQKRIQSLPE